MKILCMSCKSAFTVVAIKGNKSVQDVNKVVIRCPMCTPLMSHVPRPVPETERQKDDIRILLLDETLWPTAERYCVKGQKEPDKYLLCTACPYAGSVDKQYCERAKERNGLLLKVYQDGLDPDPVDSGDTTGDKPGSVEPDPDDFMEWDND